MFKPRKTLTAAEVDALYEYINRRLDSIGIETQPEGARTEQLRARIKLAHQQSSAARK